MANISSVAAASFTNTAKTITTTATTTTKNGLAPTTIMPVKVIENNFANLNMSKLSDFQLESDRQALSFWPFLAVVCIVFVFMILIFWLVIRRILARLSQVERLSATNRVNI